MTVAADSHRLPLLSAPLPEGRGTTRSPLIFIQDNRKGRAAQAFAPHALPINAF